MLSLPYPYPRSGWTVGAVADRQIPFQVQSSFVFWLKKQPKIYSLTQVNALPTLTNGVVAIFLLALGWLSDGPLKGRRWPIIIFVHVSPPSSASIVS